MLLFTNGFVELLFFSLDVLRLLSQEEISFKTTKLSYKFYYFQLPLVILGTIFRIIIEFQKKNFRIKFN